MVEVLVKEVMAKNVVTIDRYETVLDACNKYRDYKVGCLVVTDNGKCIGIITERDIIERTVCENKIPNETKVEEIMSSNIKTIHALDSLEKALSVMVEFNIKKLPVIQSDLIVGIITITDISRARPDISRRFIETWVKPEWKD